MLKKRLAGILGVIAALGLIFAPVPAKGDSSQDAIEIDLEDGEYSIRADLKGGSGKAGVSSPALLIVEDARAYIRLAWSSSNYDYMIVEGKKYLNEAEGEANSSFTVPVTAMDKPMDVVGDTTAMGEPHEIRYTLTLYSDTIDSKSALPQEAAKRVLMIALVIIVGGGILNAYVKKKLGE